MALGKAGDAQEGGDDRRLERFGQVFQFRIGAGDAHAVTGDDDRLFGLGQQLGRLLDLQGVAAQRRFVAGQVDLGRVVELGALLLDVARQVDEHRAGAACAGDVKGFLDRFGQVADIHHQVIVLGDGDGDAGDVGLLEGVAADHCPRHLAGDRHHGHRVHIGVGQAGDQIGGAGAGGGETDADAPGDPGIGIRGVYRPLLVADKDMAQLRVLGQRMIQRQYLAAGITEDDVDAFLEQAFA